jgi:hypothetical protein
VLPGGLKNEQLLQFLQEQLTHPSGQRHQPDGKVVPVFHGVSVQVITDDRSKAIKEIWALRLSRLAPPPPQAPSSVPPAQMKSALSPKDLASFEYVMLGLKEHRERLKSGVFRAYGLYSDLSKRAGDLRGNVEMFYAFDFPRQRIRFDRTVPSRPHERPWATPPLDRPKGPRRATAPAKSANTWMEKTQVVFTSQQVIAAPRGRQLQLYLPESRQIPDSKPFDVRALGLYYWGGFEGALSFEEEYNAAAKNKPREIERDPEGRWKIVWESIQPARSLSTIWVDEARGFTIVRMEARFPRKNVNPVAWDEPMFTNEVTWVSQGDVWVPRTFKITDRDENRLRSYDLALEWESVNQPVPEKYFTIEGLDDQTRRAVWDMKTGTPILVNVLNDPNYPGFFRSKWKMPRLLWVVLGNVGLLAVLAVALYLRWRRMANPPARP